MQKSFLNFAFKIENKAKRFGFADLAALQLSWKDLKGHEGRAVYSELRGFWTIHTMVLPETEPSYKWTTHFRCKWTTILEIGLRIWKLVLLVPFAKFFDK